MATLKDILSSLVSVIKTKLNVLYAELKKPHENIVIEVAYSDLGIPENAEITKDIMATYIATLGMVISPSKNYYFEVAPEIIVGEQLAFYISPLKNLTINEEERTSFFPMYLNIKGEQYILEDNALFTPTFEGIRSFYNAFVALLNTAPGITAKIDQFQDFTAGLEGELLIEMGINSVVFEGDFNIKYADSEDYGNSNSAEIGFSYNNDTANLYATFRQDDTDEEIGSMKFFSIDTLEPFTAYGEAVDITLLKP